MASLGAISAWAQSPPASDEQKRIEDLEKQLAEVKSQLSALQAAQTPAAAPATQPAAAMNAMPQMSATPASTPASPTISSLLGPTTLSGFVDMYYGYNSNQPSSRQGNNLFFTPYSNQFGLNMIELILDKPPDAANSRTGYHVALGFGQAMNVVNGSDPGGLGFSQYLKEAYFSYLAPVGKGLQIDAGKFVTPNGAEVIETKDNWNYTRSLLFYYAIPYYHYGMRAKYTFNDKYSLTGYFVNGWNSIVAANTGKTYGVSVGWNPNKKLGFAQNYTAGPQLSPTSDPGGSNSSWRQLWDTVITYSPTPKLSLILNGDYGRGDRYLNPITNTATSPVSWYGGAGYVKYAPNSKYAFVTRYEYFNDPDGFTTGLGPALGLGQHMQEVTGTFERTIAGHIISRFEYRHDLSNQPFFPKGTSALAKTQNTVTAGLVFTFNSQEAK
jgi:Putative beta-barrel porin-2, OmpL-like. bbp2